MNDKYVERATHKETIEEIYFGEKARSIFDPSNTISNPILYLLPRGRGYAEIFQFRTGDLEKLRLRVSPPYSIQTLVKTMIPLLKGLIRLHNKKIIHHDIKLGNILYENKPRLHFFLIDWGTACPFAYVFSDRYHYWLSAPNSNHPPEYKIMAKFAYDLQYDDLKTEFSQNPNYDRIFKKILPRYDFLIRKADRELRQKLEKNPHFFDDLADRVDVFAIGIVLCYLLMKSNDTVHTKEFRRYLPMLQGMIHPDIRKRWTLKKCILYLEQK